MPHILITNDDGVHAPGLRALVASLAGLGTLSVVAPHEERSGAAQSITLKQPIICEQVAEREWAVHGTPADAMILALHRILPQPPDLVVSGINRGANMGENVYYSGTVGAAMEATINRIPAMAVSLAHRGSTFEYSDAAAFARRLAELALQDGLPAGMLLNVNVPVPWRGAVRLTRQSEKITRNLLKDGTDPRGRSYYWLHEQAIKDGIAPETDYAAVFEGAISITPLELDRTHEVSLQQLAHWAQRLSQ
jgi:5'-nucleotidase